MKYKWGKNENINRGLIVIYKMDCPGCVEPFIDGEECYTCSICEEVFYEDCSIECILIFHTKDDVKYCCRVCMGKLVLKHFEIPVEDFMGCEELRKMLKI